MVDEPTNSKGSPWVPSNPNAVVRLIPSGDKEDQRRDELNANDMGEIDRLVKLRNQTQDPDLQATYTREINRLSVDVLADMLARIAKWDRKCPTRHWQIIDFDSDSGWVRVYATSSRDSEEHIRQGQRNASGYLRMIVLSVQETAPPSADEGEWPLRCVQPAFQWQATAEAPETRQVCSYDVVANGLDEVYSTMCRRGYSKHFSARLYGLHGELCEAISIYKVMGVSKRTSKRKGFRMYGRNSEEVQQQFACVHAGFSFQQIKQI